MVETIINSVVSICVSGIIGFLLGQLKSIRAIKKALMILLQGHLTSTYFAYEHINKIPDYVYQGWLNELREYEALGGDDYIHTLADKMKNWDITKTDILEGKYERRRTREKNR